MAEHTSDDDEATGELARDAADGRKEEAAEATAEVAQDPDEDAESPLGDDEPSPHTIHDARFKEAFSNPKNAADLMRTALPPAIAAHIDWEQLKTVQANVQSRNHHQLYGDILFRTRLCDAHEEADDEHPIFLWLMLEHQSTVDHFMPLRIADFTVAIWKRWRKHNPDAKRLPAILPIVCYQGPEPWNAATTIVELIDLPDDILNIFRAHLLECGFVLDDLGAVNHEGLSARVMNPEAKLELVILRYAATPELIEQLERFVELIQSLQHATSGDILWANLVRYMYDVNAYLDSDELIEHLNRLAIPGHEQTMLTITQQLKRQGRREERLHTQKERLRMQKELEHAQEAKQRAQEETQRAQEETQRAQEETQRAQEEKQRAQKAKQRAQEEKQRAQEEKRQFLRMVLESRFGPASDTVSERIARARDEDISHWMQRVLHAVSLEDVFATA